MRAASPESLWSSGCKYSCIGRCVFVSTRAEPGAVKNLEQNQPYEELNRFEQKFEQMNRTIGDIEGRLRISEDARHGLEGAAADLKSQLFSANEKTKCLETDLRIEREWRSQATSSLQVRR